jgi:hypothetical protein
MTSSYLHDEMLETIAEAAHEGWMAAKHAQGITTRKGESGEEFMVPYAQLSEQAKELDRQAVRSVLDAIIAAGYVVVKQPE